MAVTGDPALRPQNAFAKADSTQATATQVSENVGPRRKTKESRRSRNQTANGKSSEPNRIVRRWREVEHEGGGGETRKVIYVRRGTLQRDSYFETAR
jgi:hypothetical protein